MLHGNYPSLSYSITQILKSSVWNFVLIIRNYNFIFSGLNCTPPAIDDFPRDFFTEEERRKGAVVLHVLVSLYLFVALAVVCDKYFVPAVEKICQGNFFTFHTVITLIIIYVTILTMFRIFVLVDTILNFSHKIIISSSKR